MRLGQTSVVYFTSRFGSSIVGFLATVYIARELGSGPLGVYFLTLAVVGWLKIGNVMGVSTALTKRISEAEDKSQHAAAGVMLTTAFFAIIAAGVYLFRGQVNAYLGEPLYKFVVVLLGVNVAYAVSSAVIHGERLVHVQGVMGMAQTILRASIQIGAVFLGFGVVGLLVGEIIGFVAVTVGGVVVVVWYYGRSPTVRLPERRHFRSVFDFAKYSWLSDLQGKAYNLLDKVVLGFFVSSGLIGIYSICWNVSAVLSLFSKSIGATFFPEMSKLSSDDEPERVARYLEDTLAYSGLLIIPGFVGALIVGRGILNMYGSEFRQGYLVLVLLVGATVFHSYYNQLINAMDAIDRPDLSFKANAFFVLSNVCLNVTLIYRFGWVGAAVATLLSVGLTTVLCYRIMDGIVDVSIPYLEISRQVLAAALMGVTVFTASTLLSGYGVNTHRVIPVVSLIGLGTAVYFVSLIGIWPGFRSVVSDNVPWVDAR